MAQPTLPASVFVYHSSDFLVASQFNLNFASLASCALDWVSGNKCSPICLLSPCSERKWVEMLVEMLLVSGRYGALASRPAIGCYWAYSPSYTCHTERERQVQSCTSPERESPPALSMPIRARINLNAIRTQLACKCASPM